MQEVELCQNVKWCISWGSIISVLFVLAYRPCSSNLRWRGGGRGVYVCLFLCVCRAKQLGGLQLWDVLRGTEAVNSWGGWRFTRMNYWCSGKPVWGFLWEIACQTWEVCRAFVIFFPFNLNSMLIPPAALFQTDLLRAVNLRFYWGVCSTCLCRILPGETGGEFIIEVQ